MHCVHGLGGKWGRSSPKRGRRRPGAFIPSRSMMSSRRTRHPSKKEMARSRRAAASLLKLKVSSRGSLMEWEGSDGGEVTSPR
ncbi:hypothetical protein Naga_102290g1 [Nannochloropsis gaditana]|uniref:Uncharacterized protein n=1 Tax=Nannochloropsis gaditana TaxID=72520 RepID=W7TI07_9STRA|nr:hypothetical protein Naga_102290g1 [Nannochloropsis gaditana]